MRSLLTTAAAGAATGALLLAGCGSSGSSSAEKTATATPAATQASSSTSSSSSSTSGGGASSLTVKETEYAIAPKDGSVKAGKVTFKVDNAGAIVHALTIKDGAGKGKDVTSGNIQSGASKTVTADLKPGTYKWYCPIPGHEQAGMVGTLTVK